MASHGFGLCPRMPAHWPVVTHFYMFLLFISSWVRILKKNQTVLTTSSIKWQLYLGTLPAVRKALSRLETVGERDHGVRRSRAPLGRLLTPVPDTQTLSPSSPTAWRGVSRTGWEAWGSPSTGRPAETACGGTARNASLF